MTDPKNDPQRPDKDSETLSKVNIDGNFTIPAGNEDQTAYLPPPTGTAATHSSAGQAKGPGQDPTMTQGLRGGDTIPAAGTSRAKAIPKVRDTSASDMKAGKILGTRFEILSAIGKGGMGEVFLVRDREIENREVALKLVRSRWSADPRFRELFFQEIRSAQGFVSEHAVQVRDCGEFPDGQLFLTMDYVEGESLTSLLKREKTLMPRHALEIARQVLLGLASGHERGLIHRDVKPSNVMLSARIPKTGENPHGVKVGLLDFGIAGLTKDLEAGQGPGTPHYMSPEQATGEKLDARSDLFAVGVMLFEMISGTRPFDGRTQQEITTSVIETDPIPLVNRLDGLKKPIKRILRKALQKKREKRFSSAADFIAAIESSNSFKQTEGVPGWIAGVAVVMTVATAGLAWVNNDLKIHASDGGSAKADELRIKLQEETIAENKEELRSKSDAIVVLKLDGKRDQNRIRKLKDDVTKALNESSSTATKSNSAQLVSLSEQTDKGNVIQILNGHIKDLLFLTGSALDNYGANLCMAGTVFDELTSSIVNGTIDGRSRIIDSAIKNRGIAADTLGFRYLDRVEDLANRAQAFAIGASAGNESFVALAALRTDLEDLSGPVARGGFEVDTISLDENDAKHGKWFAVRQRSSSDLTDHLINLANQADGLDLTDTNSAVEDVAQESGGDISAAKQQKALDDARSAVNSTELVRQKVALRAWIHDRGNERVAIALYGAQVSEATRDERLAALDATFAAIRKSLDGQDHRLADASMMRIAQIDGSPDLAARTGLVVSFLEDFGVYANDHASELVEAVVARYRAKVVADGSLTIAGLRELPSFQLDELVRIIVVDDNLGLEIDAQVVHDLKWLAGAQRWYLGGRRTQKVAWFDEFAEAELGRPTSAYEEPWKQLLAFQYQLKKRCDLMEDVESIRIFATYPATGGAAGQMEWKSIEIDGTGSSRLLKERDINLNGRTGTERDPLELDPFDDASDVVEWRSTELLRLRDLPNDVEFVAWTPELPDARAAFEASTGRIFRSMNRNNTPESLVQIAYRGMWTAGSDPLLCLRVEDSRGLHVLVHPVLGVVRQEFVTYHAELVHLEK